jgi:hypothetical protein
VCECMPCIQCGDENCALSGAADACASFESCEAMCDNTICMTICRTTATITNKFASCLNAQCRDICDACPGGPF